MREIKFRGLTIQSHMWECGDLIKDRNGKCFIHFYDCNGFECSYEVIPETVGQYIGLKDKNGKEIYEGDIVAYEHRNKTYREEVIYDGYMFDVSAFYCQSYDYPTIAFSEGTEAFEVIGNIHENPELLKGE